MSRNPNELWLNDTKYTERDERGIPTHEKIKEKEKKEEKKEEKFVSKPINAKLRSKL